MYLCLEGMLSETAKSTIKSNKKEKGKEGKESSSE